jgi:hypothetical protein
MTNLINEHQSADMQNVASHAQHAIATDRVGCLAEPPACSDEHIIGETTQQDQHLLRRKALFATFREAQFALVLFQRGFDASPTLVVKGHI